MPLQQAIAIEPHEIDPELDFSGAFYRCEFEMIAQDIVRIARIRGRWAPVSAADIEEIRWQGCLGARSALEAMAASGFLRHDGNGRYYISEAFLERAAFVVENALRQRYRLPA